MSPIEREEIGEYAGGGGEFISIRKLLPTPGTKVTVKLFDINKNYKTKYPIKDKEYNYRVTLEKDQKKYLLDMSGKDSIRQVTAALYPAGPAGPLTPCFATLTRRAERKTYQGELELERGDNLDVVKEPDDLLTI